MRLRKILMLVMTSTLILSLFTAQGAVKQKFDDLENYEWAKESINYFYQQGIVDGIGQNKFAPENPVTREQFSKMLMLTFKAPLSKPKNPTFSDVPKDRWSYQYVEAAKDYMTGYSSPFDNKPSFHPEEAASREDIAVALVKVLGYTDKDARKNDYAKMVFTDASRISPQLLGYVSIAAEKGLIRGYNDNTFKPDKSVNRAEAVVLLSRASKLNKVIFETSEPELTVTNCPERSYKEKVTITGTVEDENDSEPVVTINNKKADCYRGEWSMTVYLTEGKNRFIIKAENYSGKSTTIERTIKYILPAPELKITSCPETSSKDKVVITGTVKDENDNAPRVFVNREEVDVVFGKWSKTVYLKEGKNIFTIKAVNDDGEEASEERTIIYSIGTPKITFTNCPEITNQKTISITGKVEDSSYVELYMNDQQVSLIGNSFTKKVTLNEGDNTYVFRAINEYGKSSMVTKKIVYSEIKAPNLTVDEVNQTSTVKDITISGSVSDLFDSNVEVFVNDKKISTSNGRWSTVVSLKEGLNEIIVIAVNKYNKSTLLTKFVTYTPAVK